jgi:hypothetical protein
VVARFAGGGQHSPQVLLAQDALCQAVLVAGERQLAGWVRGKVLHAVAEAEQTFDRGDGACAGDGGQTLIHQELREVLKVA